MAKADLTAQRLRELLHYDPETGVFTRAADTYRRIYKIGDTAGCVGGPGYVYISVEARSYLAHRLAWLYMTGEWPKHQIDHINSNRIDNRFINLRDVPPHVNNENRRSVRSDNMSSGMTGVSWHVHSKKWRARIWVRGVERRIGLYDTAQAASEAYLHHKRLMHTGCTI